MASRFRLLLDQNFPNPPGFDVAEVDSSVEVVHLGLHDPTLTAGGTPDWVIYLRAAHDGFDALVTRDLSQTELPEEMLVLTRVRLTLVAFREAVEDPIVEWGQLLAYLPRPWAQRFQAITDRVATAAGSFSQERTSTKGSAVTDRQRPRRGGRAGPPRGGGERSRPPRHAGGWSRPPSSNEVAIAGDTGRWRSALSSRYSDAVDAHPIGQYVCGGVHDLSRRALTRERIGDCPWLLQ